MAIAAPIAGAYTSTWNSNAMGYTRQGFNISLSQKGERIEESDIYGLSLLDIVGRGAQLSIDAIFRIWSSAVYGAQYAWGSKVFGNIYAAATPIGTLASSVGQNLVLTVVANTPAAGNPTSLTAKTIIAPDSASQITFNSTIRDTPIQFAVLTADSAGTGSLFSVT